MSDEVTEALRSAQELCSYLWNNINADDPSAGNVELVAHSDKHAEQLAALLNDARTRIDAALHGLEIQQATLGVARSIADDCRMISKALLDAASASKPNDTPPRVGEKER